MSEPFQPATDPDDTGTTQLRIPVRTPHGASVPGGTWVHSLRVVEGIEIGRRYRLGEQPMTIGRRSSNQLVIPDSEVSSEHCMVHATGADRTLEVLDRGSTNGTFVDGRRVRRPARLADGGLLQIGRHVLVHECRTLSEMEHAEHADRELERARRYVESLLPAPIREGPVRTAWFFRPSATLGGDAFGTLRIDGQRFAGYVIDVTGHGVGVAMHTVSLMNVLRQRALPDTDLADPAQVLNRLNGMFQMDDHDGLCFTMWYGVYDAATRQLAYASAGHHPALLGPPGRTCWRRLGTRSLPLGTLLDTCYRAERTEVSAGSELHLFSDGLFEVTGIDGRIWGYDDVIPFIDALEPGDDAPARLYAAVRSAVGGAPLDDDCSIVTVTFP